MINLEGILVEKYTSFPSCIKALAHYVHNKCLKFMIYSEGMKYKIFTLVFTLFT